MTHALAPEPQLTDYRDAAPLLHRHRDTLRADIKSGKVRGYRIGRRLLVNLDEVLADALVTPLVAVKSPNVPRPVLAPRPATLPARVPATIAEARAMRTGAAA